MRPQISDQTAEVVEELADELTKIDVDMLTFDQQLQIVLKQVEDIEIKPRHGNGLTREGRILAKLDE